MALHVFYMENVSNGLRSAAIKKGYIITVRPEVATPSAKAYIETDKNVSNVGPVLAGEKLLVLVL